MTQAFYKEANNCGNLVSAIFLIQKQQASKKKKGSFCKLTVKIPDQGKKKKTQKPELAKAKYKEPFRTSWFEQIYFARTITQPKNIAV